MLSSLSDSYCNCHLIQPGPHHPSPKILTTSIIGLPQDSSSVSPRTLHLLHLLHHLSINTFAKFCIHDILKKGKKREGTTMTIDFLHFLGTKDSAETSANSTRIICTEPYRLAAQRSSYDPAIQQLNVNRH